MRAASIMEAGRHQLIGRSNLSPSVSLSRLRCKTSQRLLLFSLCLLTASCFAQRAFAQPTSELPASEDQLIKLKLHSNNGTTSNPKALATLSKQAAANQSSASQLQAVRQANLSNEQLLQNNATTAATSDRNAPAEVDPNSGIVMKGVIIANYLIFFIGLCGNTVVIIVILRFTRIETVTDIYILNLAFADLMFTMGLVFLNTTMTIEQWIFGNVMCKLYMASTSLNQFASSLLLVIMSFDRYLAVCHPIYAQRFRRTRRAKVICLAIWIICLILMTPIFAFAKIDNELTCAIFWPEYQSFNCEVAFTLYSFAIGFAVPLLLIACFYLCVIRTLRLAASGPLGGSSARRTRSRESTNRRIEHLVIGIICTYTICWSPYWIGQLWVSFSPVNSRKPEGFYEFVLISSSLSYTNSALNPILYAFLSDNFKRRCSDIFNTITSIKWMPLFASFGSRSARRSKRARSKSVAATNNSCANAAATSATNVNQTPLPAWQAASKQPLAASPSACLVAETPTSISSPATRATPDLIATAAAAAASSTELNQERSATPTHAESTSPAAGRRQRRLSSIVAYSVDSVVIQTADCNQQQQLNNHQHQPVNKRDKSQCQQV